MVCDTGEETLNKMLDEETDRLCNADYYPKSNSRCKSLPTAS